MHKRIIKYKDFNDEEREEYFYFNLSKSEVTKMELSTEGGLKEKVESLVRSRKGEEIMNILEGIILGSYGIKSPDGRNFMKSQQISDDFKSTPAYDILFFELVTDAEKSAAFIQAILPKDMTSNQPPTPK
jgi:hypothetical protein